MLQSMVSLRRIASRRFSTVASLPICSADQHMDSNIKFQNLSKVLKIPYDERQMLHEINFFNHNRKPTPLSLHKLTQALTYNQHLPIEKRLIHNAQFLHNELSVRIAGVISLLDQMPYGLNLMPSVRIIRGWYYDSFVDLRSFGLIATERDQQRFTRMLEQIYDRHGSTLTTVCRGVKELKEEFSKNIFKLPIEHIDFSAYLSIHDALDKFYMSRIGLRTLIGHHLELHKQLVEPQHDYIGLVCTKTSPWDITEMAIDSARYMSMRNFGNAPEVKITGNKDLTFPYIPSHLYYILFELLKNSMRAEIEHSKKTKRYPLQPIQVVIAGNCSSSVSSSSSLNVNYNPSNKPHECEDVSIKVSDMGGGIPRSQLANVWSYLYTTSSTDLTATDAPDFDRETAPLAGLGVGLPLSKLYARYLGGEVQLASMEGYGTDAYVHLDCKSDKLENLL